MIPSQAEEETSGAQCLVPEAGSLSEPYLATALRVCLLEEHKSCDTRIGFP